MELSAEIDVQLAKGLSGAKVKVQLMYVLIYRRPSNTVDDTFLGLCDFGLCCFIRTWLVAKQGTKAATSVLVGSPLAWSACTLRHRSDRSKPGPCREMVVFCTGAGWCRYISNSEETPPVTRPGG